MTEYIRKFLANIRRRLFARRVNREIFQKVFPHVRGDANHGYPFSSKDEMVRAHIRGHLQASADLDLIERTAAQMPKAYGDAFRYLVYRDLNRRVEMYLEIAEERIEPECCDPRFVATHV